MKTLPVDLFIHNLPQIKALLTDLVQIESPSTHKVAVDQLGQRIIDELIALDAEIQVFPQAQAGNHLAGRWGRGPGGLLLLCHMDTVYDMGTLVHQPLYESGGKLFGPGVMDMKGGIVILLTVLRMFREQRIWPDRPVNVLFTSDEEVGSLTSRALIENEARQAGMVFCLEPALASGAIKTARKGTGDIEIHVKGVAAHAGVDHEKGRNAIEELAHHILAAQKLTDYNRGTTVNVGVIAGGTRTNVVPDEAHALVDFRVTNMDEVERLETWTSSLSPYLPGTSVSAVLTLNRPPMPRNQTMAHAYQKAQAIAQEIGLQLTEGSTGGGSDANFVAPLGTPVLDGLGGVGDGAHSEREYVLVESLAERAALLAALLLNW
jgi:glutamate carboxypeptidase